MTNDSLPPVEAKKPLNLFNKGNIALTLGIMAVVLAGAPYVVPALQARIVHQGLVNHPQTLEEAIKALDGQKKAELQTKAEIAIKANHDALYTDARDPVIGNPNAPITIVEFLDYNCTYCKMAAPEIEKLLAENRDIKIVVKEYPIIADSSRALASYALATKDTGRYEDVHHAFMKAQFKTEDEVRSALNSMGFDANAVMAKAKSQEVQNHIDAVDQLGKQLNIDGTPTFIIGGVLVNGADMDALNAAIEAQRSAPK